MPSLAPAKKQKDTEPLNHLYPYVDRSRTPLPTGWSSKAKHQFLGLSQDNRRLHYKGAGKTHKDAAACRATHPIPAACGLYYYEVKIVSKGRDGYMGIGFAAANSSIDKLPGWDKMSYGYHGDDGCSFWSTGQGNQYGPTFTTGDVIGCALNLVDRTCFYTKNGHTIGVSFSDMPASLYPAVGLQTPGEVVEANFGQEPFVYDIEDEMREVQARVWSQVSDITLSQAQLNWMPRLVLSYLTHCGYPQTAQAFATSSQLPLGPAFESINTRQRIRRLIRAGQIAESIELLQTECPSLLEKQPELFFLLKCRQFIEMIGSMEATKRASSRSSSTSATKQASPSRLQQRASHLHSKTRHSPIGPSDSPPLSLTRRLKSPRVTATASFTVAALTQNGHSNGVCNNGDVVESMDCSDGVPVAMSNGASSFNGAATLCLNGTAASNASPLLKKSLSSSHSSSPVTVQRNGDAAAIDTDGSGEGSDADGSDVDLVEFADRASRQRQRLGDLVPPRNTVRGWSSPDVDRYRAVLDFGRELLEMQRSCPHMDPKNKQMLEHAYALLAYRNPHDCPVSHLLEPSQREPVAAAINSAILQFYSCRPVAPLETVLRHHNRLRRHMSERDAGACAFVDAHQVLTRDFAAVGTSSVSSLPQGTSRQSSIQLNSSMNAGLRQTTL